MAQMVVAKYNKTSLYKTYCILTWAKHGIKANTWQFFIISIVVIMTKILFKLFINLYLLRSFTTEVKQCNHICWLWNGCDHSYPNMNLSNVCRDCVPVRTELVITPGDVSRQISRYPPHPYCIQQPQTIVTSASLLQCFVHINWPLLFTWHSYCWYGHFYCTTVWFRL